MKKSVVVTGGGGFIGSHLVGTLLDDHHVTVIDNFSTGARANLRHVRNHPLLRIVRGDIRNYTLVHRVLRDATTVFHLAAQTSVPGSIRDPLFTNQVNVGGTVNLLKGSLDNRIDKFVLASTCSVYGNAKSEFQNESTPPEPVSPYPASKLADESYCKAFSNSYGLETMSLRFFNVYGPRQRRGTYAGVISAMIDCTAKGIKPTVYGTGDQVRDFVFVSDVG